MADFHKRLRELIEEKRRTEGILQNDLAKHLHVRKSTVSNWVNTERFPDEDILKKIADFYNVTVDYLLGNTDIKDALIVNEEINGHKVELEIDRNVYPDGLTHEQVIEILEKMKAMGINLPDMVSKKNS
jgi:transcriptional regulator with XRE-family HTH domain